LLCFALLGLAGLCLVMSVVLQGSVCPQDDGCTSNVHKQVVIS
jgi:hypothetical protein